MSTMLRNSFQNRINLLRSAARWLGTRANTVWAKQYKSSELMSEYAASLQELADILPQHSDISRLVEVIEHHPALTLEGELSSLLASIKRSLAPVSLSDVFAQQSITQPPVLSFLLYFSPELGHWLWECKSTGEVHPATATEIELWKALEFHKKG